MKQQNVRERVDALLNDVESPAGRKVALFIQGLILLSAVSITLDTFRNLPPWLHTLLDETDRIILLFFTMEYLLRLWASMPRLRYALSAWGMVDLLAIAPFWLFGSDVRIIRTLRLLRLVKILRFSGYARAMSMLARAFAMVREEIIAFMGISFLLLYLTAYAIWQFENAAQPDRFANMFDAFWWAVITLTTVGYGDMYPVTIGGRLFTILIVLLGLGLVAVPSGLLASAFHEIRRQEHAQCLPADHDARLRADCAANDEHTGRQDGEEA